MEKLTGFGMKISLTLPCLAIKYLNSLRDEYLEPIYKYTDPFMRNFVRQSIKGGWCVVLNQYCKSTISDEVFNIISKELGVNDNICEILDKCFKIQINIEKWLKTTKIHILRTIEITIKKEEPNIIAKNLTN